MIKVELKVNTEPYKLTQTQKIRIEPTHGWRSLNLNALWEYRELIYFLAWRDIKVRYKQTVLGIIWAIIQPIVSMVIFTVIFGKLAKISSDGNPYPVFCLCAILPWNYFSVSFGRSSGSLINNSQLISKVYFPRLVIPISSIVSGLLDFVIAFVILIGLMFWYSITPATTIFMFPAFLMLVIANALAAGLWLGALNVKYRDISYITPFLINIWMYATPVIYSVNLIPERWRLFYALNPMVGVVEGFRWSLLGHSDSLVLITIVSVSVTFILLVSGTFYFKRMERTFADVI